MLEALQNTTIQMVDVDSIQSAPFNPKNRIEKHRLKKLLEDIRTVGFVMSQPRRENTQ